MGLRGWRAATSTDSGISTKITVGFAAISPADLWRSTASGTRAIASASTNRPSAIAVVGEASREPLELSFMVTDARLLRHPARQSGYCTVDRGRSEIVTTSGAGVILRTLAARSASGGSGLGGRPVIIRRRASFHKLAGGRSANNTGACARSQKV